MVSDLKQERKKRVDENKGNTTRSGTKKQRAQLASSSDKNVQVGLISTTKLATRAEEHVEWSTWATSNDLNSSLSKRSMDSVSTFHPLRVKGVLLLIYLARRLFFFGVQDNMCTTARGCGKRLHKMLPGDVQHPGTAEGSAPLGHVLDLLHHDSV